MLFSCSWNFKYGADCSVSTCQFVRDNCKYQATKSTGNATMKSVVSDAHNIHGRDISLRVSRRWMTVDLDQRFNTARSTEAPGHTVDMMDHIDRLNELR